MAMAVSSQQSRDAALLRATTELFVLERGHDRDEIRRFEELATHFLAKVTSADRAFIAERLARHPDAPTSILRMLGKDIIEVASPILRHAAALATFDLIAIMAASGPAHYRLIARRPDLPKEVVAALRMTDDPETLALLPAATTPRAYTEPTFERKLEPVIKTEIVLESKADNPPGESMLQVTARAPANAAPTAEPAPIAERPFAEKSPPLVSPKAVTTALDDDFAAILDDLAGRTPPAKARIAVPVKAASAEPAPAKASDIPPPVQATEPQSAPVADAPAEVPSLPGARAFLMLGRDERLALLQRHSPQPAGPHRPASPLELDRAFQAAVSRARVPTLARQKQRAALIDTIAAGLELTPDIVAALMDDPSGEALVVLLKAIGLTDSEAQQVLLLANPAIGEAVGSFFRLAQLFGRLERTAAEALVLHWRRTAADDKPSGYVPYHAATEPSRSARSLPASTTKADPEERSVFGRRGMV